MNLPVKQFVIFALLHEKKLTDDFRNGKETAFPVMRLIRYKRWRQPHVCYMVEQASFDYFQKYAEAKVIRVAHTERPEAVLSDDYKSERMGMLTAVSQAEADSHDERYHVTDTGTWYVFSET